MKLGIMVKGLWGQEDVDVININAKKFKLINTGGGRGRGIGSL
jgi:hypothetical protein